MSCCGIQCLHAMPCMHPPCRHVMPGERPRMHARVCDGENSNELSTSSRSRMAVLFVGLGTDEPTGVSCRLAEWCIRAQVDVASSTADAGTDGETNR